jgi:hypothetical protein
MVHKFQNKVSLTFEQHFRMQFANIVSLLRDLENEVDTERLLGIISKWGERRGTEMVGEKRVVSFEEFKEYWKAASKDHYFANSVTIEFPHETESELQCNLTKLNPNFNASTPSVCLRRHSAISEPLISERYLYVILILLLHRH